MTPIVDCHTHTFYSDGQDSPEANVAAAEAAGCKVLVATDHLTLPAEMDPKQEVGVHEEDLSRRAADFAAAAERIHLLKLFMDLNVTGMRVAKPIQNVGAQAQSYV